MCQICKSDVQLVIFASLDVFVRHCSSNTWQSNLVWAGFKLGSQFALHIRFLQKHHMPFLFGKNMLKLAMIKPTTKAKQRLVVQHNSSLSDK